MVDQSQEPAADYESSGSKFQALGDSWTITEGPIRVLLSNLISVYGKHIMADAVRIAPESNNGAPSFDDQSFTLAENSNGGTVVGTLAATDPEGHTLSYSIPVNIDPDGDGIAAFRIEGDQLLVNDSGDLDYETGPQLVITAQASDGSLSDTATSYRQPHGCQRRTGRYPSRRPEQRRGRRRLATTLRQRPRRPNVDVECQWIAIGP